MVEVGKTFSPIPIAPCRKSLKYPKIYPCKSADHRGALSLDTDICSYAMKRRSATLREKLMTFAPRIDPKVSVITAFELYNGAYRLPETAKIRAIVTIKTFLTNVEVLDFGRQAAEHASAIRAQLAGSGQPIGAFDLLIAAQARSMGAIMVTNNISEFGRVDGLTVENWFNSST
ncbi:MAG: PIN domain-containing protein [Candidatus Competibacteraceae bacterium]